MNLEIEVHIGKKFAIYLPRAIVKALGLKEGEKVLLRVSGNSIIIETLKDPIQLALSREKFATMTPDEIEAISLEEQEKYTGDSS